MILSARVQYPAIICHILVFVPHDSSDFLSVEDKIMKLAIIKFICDLKPAVLFCKMEKPN